MSPKTIHMIGQAHLDPVWLWTWSEGRAEALATSQSAVDRLDEYPAFHFTRGEAQVYRWIEQEDPRLFARIKALIKAGRWHVVNGMIVQPDMNLPQGESFIRHFLLGKRYMREHLGVEPKIAYCVDSFGHAATLPQIFKKCGCDAYVFMRPGSHEMQLPSQAFWWQATDGSRVLAFRIPDGYTTSTSDQAGHIQRTLQAMPPELANTMCFFGVGDHGGGPTKAQIENIQALASANDAEEEIRFSSPEEYFTCIAAAAETLPVVEDELYFHAVGCYAANSQLKRAHRKAECALLGAERLATLAGLLVAADPPKGLLTELWWTLCFNQFHDILGGCSIKTGADDAIAAFHHVTQQADQIIYSAGRAIAAKINTLGPGGSKDGGSVVLFNPAGQPFNGYVEYEPWTDGEAWLEKKWGWTDEQGRPVAYQLCPTNDATFDPRSNGLRRLLWRAELPPFGYRVYHFAHGLPQATIPSAITATPGRLENDCLAVELDPASGEIISCRLKPDDLELVGPGHWNTAQVLEDTSDTWSHAVTHFGQVITRFTRPHVQVYEQGPLQSSVLIQRTLELDDGTHGRWEQLLTLRRGETELALQNWLSWEGQFKTVKLGFDLAARAVSSSQHVPFGWVERSSDGNEHAAHFWVDLHGDSSVQPGQMVGVAVLNDGKYSGDVNGSTFRQTILRCPPYAYHTPHPFGSKSRYDWLDQGVQEFTLLLRPHRGAWQSANVQQRAAELNLPVVAITQHAHAGPLPPLGQACEIKSAAVELSALKPAEDGGGIILRLAERFGRSTRCELSWFEQSFWLDFGPLEVKTLLLTKAGDRWKTQEVNMLERAG